MKTILNTLLLSAFVLCELPPPYSHRGFRASPQFLHQFSSLRSPQTQYGPPKLQTNTLDVEIPSRLTIEQLIRLTEKLHSSQGRIVNKPQTIRASTSQSSYLPPPRQPQRVYGAPSKFEFSQSQLRPPPVFNFGISQPQSVYGAPQIPQQTLGTLRPQNQYGPPPQSLNTGTSSSQSSPQTTYGVPNIPQLPQPTEPNNFGVSNQLIPPSTNYGVPDLRSIETFGELRNKPQNDEDILRQNLLRDLGKQHLPYREPTGFRPQGSQSTEVQNSQQYLPINSQGGVNNQGIPQSSGGITESQGNQGFIQGGSTSRPQNVPNQQYLPANSGQRPQNGLVNGQQGNIPSNVPQTTTNGGGIPQSGNKGEVNPGFSQGGSPFGTTPPGSTLNNGQNYLPPHSTPKPVFSTQTTTARPRTIETTPLTSEGTTNYDYDYDLQQPTESSTNQDESAVDPNVSISNAVAGGGGFFYLQQPDGRLQRVVLQKTQEQNSKPEEYVANYYFQNIQALPSVTYTPLVSLGAWK